SSRPWTRRGSSPACPSTARPSSSPTCSSAVPPRTAIPCPTRSSRAHPTCAGSSTCSSRASSAASASSPPSCWWGPRVRWARCGARSIVTRAPSSSSPTTPPIACGTRRPSARCGRTCSSWRASICRTDRVSPGAARQAPRREAAMTEIGSRPALAPGPGLVPPQALEAERSVLASMLLGNEAVGRAVEQIDASVFYRTAHQRIFEALVALYNRNERADSITVTEELRKRGDLEAVGGAATIAQILEYATTTANLDEHIKIVASKAVLRLLIRAAQEIQEESFAAAAETGDILDRAEQRIFAITDARVRQGFVPLKSLLKPAFEHIQTLFERKEHVTGVPSGYVDIDKLTAGFQKGDLVIIAGRPSMGK